MSVQPAAPVSAPAVRPPAAAADAAQLRATAREFEAMAIGQLLQPMFATVDGSRGLFGGGAGEAAWKPMMVDEMARMLARNGGIGIADAVFREMLRMQEQARG